jgi:hypothetical protein
MMMRSAIERKWTPVLGAAYAHGIAQIKFFMFLALISLGVFWAVAIGLAIGAGPGLIPVMLVLMFAPSVALILGLVLLFRFGKRISTDLREAGVNVREACFARSTSDISSWSARNGVDMAKVIDVGNSKYGFRTVNR